MSSSSNEENLQDIQDGVAAGEVDAIYTTTASGGRSRNGYGTTVVLLTWALQLGREFVWLLLI